MYFRNLPRSINSHRKTHNGPLFAPISTIRIFQRYSVYRRTKNNCWLDWQWKKRIIHRIGTIYFSDQNWSNPRCFDYIYIHTSLYIWNRFLRSFSSISRTVVWGVSVLLSRIVLAIFRACAHFTLFRILSHLKELHYRSCEIQVSDPNRNTPDSREKQVRARGKRVDTGRIGYKGDEGERGRERERETSLKSHVNLMGHGSRVHRSINLDRDKSLCKRFKLSNGHLSDVASSVSLFPLFDFCILLDTVIPFVCKKPSFCVSIMPR